MNVATGVRRIREVLQTDGSMAVATKILAKVRRTVRRRFEKPDEFDRLHGTDTSRFEYPNVSYGRYQAIAVTVFHDLMTHLPLPRERFTFIDLGCGKGRALILAREAGFGTLVGVDLALELIRTARKNLRHGGIAAQLICSDARCIRYPERPLVVFCYNAFGPDVMHDVAVNLLASVRTSPREVYFAYANPIYAKSLESFADFKLLVKTPELGVWRLAHR